MTTWTSPQTEEQKKYYSKRKGKLMAYTLTAGVIQLLWAYYDFPAYKYVLDGAFENIPTLLWTTPYAAALILLVMHYLLRETYMTYWFDRLDDDEETDSSIFIPIVLILILFIAGRYGVKMAMESQVPDPVKTDYKEPDQVLEQALNRIRTGHAEDTLNISKAFAGKIKASTISLDARIQRLRNRKADDIKERMAIKTEIANLRQQRADIVAPIERAKSDSIAAVVARFNTAKQREEAKHTGAITKIDGANTEAATEHKATLSSIGVGSWLLSVFFVFIYCALGYAIVRIKVNSGILPKRDHTVLDQYGGPLGRLLYVLQDGFNRQIYRLSLLIHRIVTAGTGTLSQMDASYIEVQADYNSKGLPAPIPISHTTPDDDDELRRKVAEKIMREASEKKITITPELLQSEFEAAKKSNGHYKDTPLGKPEPSPAQARAGEGSPTPAPKPPVRISDDDEAYWIKFFRDDILNQVAAYDAAILAGNPSQAKAHQDYINDPSGALYKLGKRLGLSWGIFDGNIYVWRDRTPGNKVLLENLTNEALGAPTPSPSRPVIADNEELFKQNVSLFKQNIQPHTDDDGRVIGIKYKKNDGNWTTYDYNTVRGQWGIYQRRAAKGEVSDAVLDGVEKWEYAMTLFEEGRREIKDNMQPITI